MPFFLAFQVVIWPMMRPPLSGCNVMLFLLVLFAQELMGKRNKERHNREANKKTIPQKCVADYCLPLEYNALELPSSERQDVQINLDFYKGCRKTRTHGPTDQLAILKYFSSFDAVRIGKKKCAPSFVSKWWCTLFFCQFLLQRKMKSTLRPRLYLHILGKKVLHLFDNIFHV